MFLPSAFLRDYFGGLSRRSVIWTVFVANTLLFGIFCGGMVWLWKILPAEGVKLHGNINTGIDLLGRRDDLAWFGGMAVIIYLSNSLLAFLFSRREKIATLYLLIATSLIMALLLATLVFLVMINNIL